MTAFRDVRGAPACGSGPAGILLQYAEEPKEVQRCRCSTPDDCGTAVDNLCMIPARTKGALAKMIETPKLTTDVIIRIWEKDRFQGIVLIDRKNPPLGLAIPGGFVEVGESVETAALREMKEEVGLDVQLVGLLGVYSDPKRDPRFHTASVVFVGDSTGDPQAASDAQEASIYRLEEIPLDRLVFDHREILLDFLGSPD